uniref:Ig-like domain-containing protein n=1 Tax=Anabas testudineus TaxID=64144 RepID=A0AAQ6IG46_ANATE
QVLLCVLLVSLSILCVILVLPSEIVEGSSVNLTCSSDANPAANYTWYKNDTHLKSIHEEPQFVFTSIKSSDSGQYYCEAGNTLGKSRSESVSIDFLFSVGIIKDEVKSLVLFRQYSSHHSPSKSSNDFFFLCVMDCELLV